MAPSTKHQHKHQTGGERGRTGRKTETEKANKKWGDGEKGKESLAISNMIRLDGTTNDLLGHRPQTTEDKHATSTNTGVF